MFKMRGTISRDISGSVFLTVICLNSHCSFQSPFVIASDRDRAQLKKNKHFIFNTINTRTTTTNVITAATTSTTITDTNVTTSSVVIIVLTNSMHCFLYQTLSEVRK